jgi:Bifunctional DNA primase/polymerase, N-terminal/AAA domain/Primase C terminal 1 (PriCT-1)
MAVGSRLERAAVELAARGYHIFPCRLDKSPLTPHGYKDATRSERTILDWWDRWPGASIGVALAASGCAVVDIDPRHGADPDELIPQLGIEHGRLVRTGEAPEPDERFPNSLSGKRGAHVWFRGHQRSRAPGMTGVDLLGDGKYVIAPPSPHESGACYEGELPPVGELPPWADGLFPEPSAKNVGGEIPDHRPSVNGRPPVADDIPDGRRNVSLASLAGSMRRRGMSAAEMLPALLAVNRRCTPPLDRRDVERIAASVGRYPPADVPYLPMDANGQPAAGPRFAVRRCRREDMRSPKWAFKGYLPLGKVSSLVGSGGAGKGTFMAWLIAQLSRGLLPGEFRHRPATTLVVGDEDSAEEVWIPRVDGAGGDVTHMFTVEYEDGTPLQVVRDIRWLEERVRDLDVNVLYFDQILDNLPGDTSTHVAGDVRQAFGPLRNLAVRLGVTVVFTTHPNKLGGVRSTRDRTGGSHQFTRPAQVGAGARLPPGGSAPAGAGARQGEHWQDAAGADVLNRNRVDPQPGQRRGHRSRCARRA